MRVTRVLLLLALALVATTQLPVTHGHAAVHDHHNHHDHHGHGEGHAHGHNHHDHHGHGEGHAHGHDHHDHHGHVEGHAHGHDHHGHKDHDHAHKHPHDHGDHQHHEHREVEAAHAHAHDHHHDHQSPVSKATTQSNIDRFSPRIWAEALFATALVGAAPVVILLFVPLGRGSVEAQKPLLRVFLSFAAGGLLGDALLHLLPHSLPTGGHDHSHDHGHSHDHDHGEGHGHSHSLQDLAVWLYCLAGMMAFLMLEKFVRAQTGDGHGHSHAHPPATSHTPPTSSTASEGEGLRQRKKKLSEEKAKEETEEDDDNDNGKTKGNQPPRIAAAGYLNLAADFSHNFTDGLAIGATFLRGSGWQTTVAMLLHEVPHEIGDFAILIQSGFTRREAMLTQLGTALGAMAGTVLGLLIEGAGDSGSAWISPFTAGGFIYIACASVMPELLEDCSLVQSLKEGVAMCLGIGLMIVIALYE